MATLPVLHFEALTCRVDVQFWFEIQRRKLHEWKDTVTPIPLRTAYPSASHDTVSAAVPLAADAFDTPPRPPFHYPMEGTLVNTNTIEELKRYDRRGMLAAAGSAIWRAVQSGAWLQDPSALNHLLLLCYADLKQHKFHFCNGFPVLLPAVPFLLRGAPAPIGTVLDSKQQASLRDSHCLLPGPPAVFLVNLLPGGEVQVHPIGSWEHQAAGGGGRVWLAVVDPCCQPQVVGWPARNALWAVTYQYKLEGSVSLLSYREVPGHNDISRSLVLEVNVSVAKLLKDGHEEPEYTGWPADNKLKMVDLSPLLNEEKLSSSSANLNLNLMKWRMLPDLDLSRLERSKCLLLGAGTLGCNVARTLMMWGVTHITLVDSGKVSYSNPVRQTLFEFADAKEARPKAEAAAAACRRVYPGCQVEGVQMIIPMPGHPVDSTRRDTVRRDVARLEDLIRAADVVFLLLDTRESRWLPTVLCTLHDKLCINAALGFGSYMVMRHGVLSQPLDQRLGCYYCTGVTAPRDSLTDRTLDQQCTVTRPGVSAIASALAVELMAAALQHPLAAAAPADTEDAIPVSLLGLVPHQIRGQVENFQQHVLYGRAYDRCTACSHSILEAYTRDGFDFVERVLNDPAHLEDLTGLRQVKEEAEAFLAQAEAEKCEEISSDDEWTM